ncbi:MAG: CHAT domain-containing protein [Porphyromonadaceae bacterium]|nr:MAG: CHAT domain-containing protein [Porphyromonadaceae bacterium]
MVLRILNIKTLTILIVLFSYSICSGQNTETSIQDLYERTNSVWKNIEDGQTVEALRMCQETINKYQHIQYADRYMSYLWNYQGEAFFRLGDIGLARSCYLLGINNAQMQQDRNLEVTIRINLAATYHEAHEYKTCLKSSKLIYLDSTAQLSVDQQAILLNNMAESSSRLKDFQGADSLFGMLFLKMKLLNGKAEYDSLLTYRNYGKYLNEKGMADVAKNYLIQALWGYQRKLGRDHYQTANSWIYLGKCYENQNLPDSALFCYKRAINILTPETQQLNEQDPHYRQVNYETIYLEALVSRGSVLQHMALKVNGGDKTGYLIRAFESFQEAAGRIDYLMRSYLFTESGFILADKVRKIFDGGIRTAIQLAELTKKRQYFNKAFLWAVESKSISLYTSALLQMNPSPDGSSYNRQVEYYVVRASLEQIRRSVEKESRPDLADSLKFLIQRFTELQDSIRASLNFNPVLPSVLQLLNIFKPASFRTRTYLGFHDLDTCLLVFGVNRHRRFYKVIPIDGNLVDSIAKFKQVLSQPLIGNFSTNQISQFTKLSNYLYCHLIQPVKSEIKSKKLLIHPDGILLGFPFEVLLTKNPGYSAEDSPISFKDLPYLSNNYSIRYISLPIQKPARNNKIVDSDSLALVIDRSDPKLKAVQDEVSMLSKEFKAIRILHEDTIRLVFKTLVNFPVIHFAGHMTWDPVDPYKSKVTQGLDWGTIISCKFNNKLVFINGCESGQGPVNRGEGLMSPGYAFALAGSPSVVENLWEASDKATSDLAGNFYKHIYDKEVPDALQSAKQDYLKKCPTGMSHPHYWAGMICYQYLSNETQPPWVLLISIEIVVIFILLIFIRNRISS